MAYLLSYLLKSILVSAILTIWYLLLLKDRNIHQYNRFYLILTVILTLLIPLINFSPLRPAIPANNLVYLTIDSISSLPAWTWSIPFFAAFISAFLIIRLLLNIGQLFRLRRKFPNHLTKDFCLVETDLSEAPFSFMNILFWNRNLDPNTWPGIQMMEHEHCHIMQKHSYDKLFLQSVRCLLWLNPVLKLIQRELNMVHEFIADEASVRPGDTASFATLLLTAYEAKWLASPAQSFFHSPVNRRLSMIDRPHIPSFIKLKKLAVLPLTILALFLCSAHIDQNSYGFFRKQRDEKRFANNIHHPNISTNGLSHP